MTAIEARFRAKVGDFHHRGLVLGLIGRRADHAAADAGARAPARGLPNADYSSDV